MHQEEKEEVPDIDLLICMDLSSSTTGILEIIHENIWKIMCDFTYYNPKPKIRLGFIGIGRPSFGKENNYISIISNLTYQYDDAVKKIFDIKPVVADRNCYFADLIYTASRVINWSKEESTLKLMYIIGNGSPFLGSADMQTSCEAARKKGIVINPVYYKTYMSIAEEKKWMDFAELCGNELSIVSLIQPMVLLKKEYDNRLLFSANTILNNTYVYYGKEGKTLRENQLMLDQKAGEANDNETESRVIFKASELYQQKNSSWDLVDLTYKEGIDFLKVENEFLPAELNEYDSAKLEAYIIGKKKERNDAIALIKLINQNRLEYLKALKKETNEKIKVDNSLPAIIIKTNSQLAQEWRFSRSY
jgi:hypothetical protein